VTRPVTPPALLPISLERDAYWALDGDALLRRLQTTPDGLSGAEAARRLRDVGPNQIQPRTRLTRTRVLLNQLRNPLLLVLVFAAAASALTGVWVDAHIVLAIVFASVGVGYAREYRAEAAAADLQARIRSRARTLRDGRALDVPVEEIVPGDVVLLSAGSLVPADGVILNATDCFISEAVLTGESFQSPNKRARSRPISRSAIGGTASFSGPTCEADRRASSS
jgi:Mg2+-importing ATPase